jgi:hypothetical protein
LTNGKFAVVRPQRKTGEARGFARHCEP